MATPLPALPSLAAFTANLASLVSSPYPPPALFLHVPGDAHALLPALCATLDRATAPPPPPASGDPPPVEHLLPKVAHLDLAHIHSTKAAFDHVLAQLSGWDAATGGQAWDDRDAGVQAWDGSMRGLRVVRSRKRRAGAAHEGRSAKRARTAREESAGWSADEAGGSEDGEGEHGDGEWTLEWDHSAPASVADKPTLAPLRNTVDAFHHSLRAIFALSTPAAPAVSSALDAAADLAPGTHAPPARRFIVIEHGELLGELTGGTGASGAARETGVGVTFASTMHRLAQLTGLPITTITVSRLPWHKARESMVGLPSPELLSFDDISSADTVTLLAARFASSALSQPSAGDTLAHAQLVELFRSLAHVVCTTFGKAVSEVDEVAFLCARFWPRWKEVRERSNPPIAPTDTARLAIALKADFAAELERLFLPREPLASSSCSSSGAPSSSSGTGAIPHGFTGTIAAPPKQPTYLDSPSRGTSAAGASSSSSSSAAAGGPGDFFAAAASSAFASPARPSAFSSSAGADPFAAAPPALSRTTTTPSARAPPNTGPVTLAKSLPLAARYLLLAAYFAAHNPPKSDVRMFVRVDELEGVAHRGKKKRRGGGARKNGGGSPKKPAAGALSGGKPFPLERLLALFEAIVDARLEYALGTPAVLAQVQTLVSLGLLARASAGDKVLDGVKLRCKVGREEADACALSVGWREWKERLVGEEE
ncbi:hypothetical protein JCM10450v2_002338 [Rhodotorula kratochvilovae]